MTTITDAERKILEDQIAGMSQIEMASLQRFAVAGHPIFTDSELYKKFSARFKALGGMTPAISKAIGF